MRVRFRKEEPTAAQLKALRAECVKEFNKMLNVYNRQAVIQILHVLRFDYGFGQKRLEKFAEKVLQMLVRQEIKYELPPEDTVWLCEKQLIESGINIDKIFGD